MLLGVFSSETKWLNEDELYVQMYNETIIKFGFRMIS